MMMKLACVPSKNSCIAAAVFVQVHGYNDQSFRSVTLLQLFHHRERFLARPAPGGPKIHEHNLALQVVRQLAFEVESFHGKETARAVYQDIESLLNNSVTGK